MVPALPALPSIGLERERRPEMAPFLPNQNNTLPQRPLSSAFTPTDATGGISGTLSFLARDSSQLFFDYYFSNLLVPYSALDQMIPETRHHQGLKGFHHIILNNLLDHKSPLWVIYYAL